MIETEGISPLRLAVEGNEQDRDALSQIEKRLCGLVVPILQFERLDDLLTEIDAFDAVVALPDSGNTNSAAETLAASDKHLLIEASILTSIDEVSHLRSVYEQSKATLVASYRLRYQAASKAVLTSLASQKLGRPGLLRTHAWSSSHAADEQLLSLIDLACTVFQSPPETVWAIRKTFSQASHCTNLHLGFPQNGMALIDVSIEDSFGAGYFTWSVIGSDGAAYIDDHHDMQLLIRDSQRQAITTPDSAISILSQVQKFLGRIANHRELRVDTSDVEVALNVAARALQSITTEAVAS
ncbi:MAG: hypothetical protein KDA52_12145 [Planctomycetaceae bacterium]|nr:hypothetical protein [Planctomycetaceae bacterium]